MALMALWIGRFARICVLCVMLYLFASYLYMFNRALDSHLMNVGDKQDDCDTRQEEGVQSPIVWGKDDKIRYAQSV